LLPGPRTEPGPTEGNRARPHVAPPSMGSSIESLARGQRRLSRPADRPDSATLRPNSAGCGLSRGFLAAIVRATVDSRPSAGCEVRGHLMRGRQR